jgi:hypothetical protein
VFLLALIGFIYSQLRMMGCDTFEPDGTLSLVRLTAPQFAHAFATPPIVG